MIPLTQSLQRFRNYIFSSWSVIYYRSQTQHCLLSKYYHDNTL